MWSQPVKTLRMVCFSTAEPSGCHFHQVSLAGSGGRGISPVTVDFRGFVARKAPHVIYGQAGRLVGFECQRGKPVQGHEGEEASVINGVLVPGNTVRRGET